MTTTIKRFLSSQSQLSNRPLAMDVANILSMPSAASSSGHPYLNKESWELLRDRIPVLFASGGYVLDLVTDIATQIGESRLEQADKDNSEQVARVIRQVILTACITAPPDLWLLRHVLGIFQQLGLLTRLLEGGGIYPEHCWVEIDNQPIQLNAEELDKDLRLLLSRGIVEQYAESYRLAGHPKAIEILRDVEPLRGDPELNLTSLWREFFSNRSMSTESMSALLGSKFKSETPSPTLQNHWIPSLYEIELGYRLVPIVLAMRACELTSDLAEGREMKTGEWVFKHPEIGAIATDTLVATGWLEPIKDGLRVTTTGGRGFARAPGPFGIIETYHPYMRKLQDILLSTGTHVWVSRGENVGASQDANRKTFQSANRALDDFCRDTEFSYSVFIEHAIGRGEATRQRFERSGDERIRYFGADLEDAAIAAARMEQEAGRLPKDMLFVTNADIGKPDILLDALRQNNADPHGSIMLVGNGFHEIREQTDDGMVAIFQKYHDAGILLIFTEENALSIDDLRETAWNTYHAGFKYVHEKSGQGLRPAHPRPPVRLGLPLRASWSTCAHNAGYVRANKYCMKTRTVYPYPPADRINPSISVNHFFVPASIALELDLQTV